MAKRELTEDDVDEIRSLHAGGLSVNAIARGLGVSWTTVKYRLERGLPPPRPGLTRAQVAEMVRLRGEGHTLRSLSAQFGVSAMTVHAHVRTAPPVPRPARSLYRNKGIPHYLLRERHSPMVEAALCRLTPGFSKYLDEDDELRRKRGPWR